MTTAEPLSAESLPRPSGPPAVGTQGMVSSAHPLATEAGLEVLAAGGNAFDATVAVAAALNVVEPYMSGLGGYGTILIYSAKEGRVRFLNPSGRIPRAVNSDLFRPPTPDFEANRSGAKAVSTPGNLHAWKVLSEEYGVRPWASLFAPAIRLASAGHTLSELDQRYLMESFSSFPPHAQAIFGQEGMQLIAGDRLVQKDLARSLTLIAEQGPSVFYGGELGRAIDVAMREAGGFLALADLEADRAEWWQPISIDYRGVKIYTASPPANSFDALARVSLMGRVDLKALGHNSTAYLHRFAEVTKLGFGLRLAYAGDPDIAPPPVERLLSEPYLAELAKQIDPEKATPFVPPGAKPGATGLHTTHFVVADAQGNVVSATQTLGNIFGSRIMAKGTGIWLNNSLEYSTFEPKGNPMDAFPGRRKLSGDVPVIVTKDGRPWIALGTPGGHTIGQTVPQMLLNLLDFGMDIAQAIAAPRISFAEPDVLLVEAEIPEAVLAELVAKGHHARPPRTKFLGNAHGLTLEYGPAGEADSTARPIRFTGAADPRGEGLAKGY